LSILSDEEKIGMSERLADLDELVIRCRNEQAKRYIAEAVSCYKTGAFRAAIVSTWVAVVYDIISKLDELALTGDKNAEAKRQEFDEYRRSADIANSLKFEKQILDIAKNDFGLISPLEHEDLQRLLLDRNRCAHPSMNSYDEVYSPSAELARYHLRNAVTHLLQHPPVQGKAALDRLLAEVESVYFPTDANKAWDFFSHGPLARPRESLVRNFTIVLVKRLVFETLDDNAILRHVVALKATLLMHREVSEKTLHSLLSATIRGAGDTHMIRVLLFVSYLPDAWEVIENDIKTRIYNCVSQISIRENAQLFADLVDCVPLREAVMQRINKMGSSDATSLLKTGPRSEYVSRCLEGYNSSKSFNQANSIATEVILPLVPVFTDRHITQLINVFSENGEITGSRQFTIVILQLLQSEQISSNKKDELIVSVAAAIPSRMATLSRFLERRHLESLIGTSIDNERLEDLLNVVFKRGGISFEECKEILTKRGIDIDQTSIAKNNEDDDDIIF
jgi:hypothetical protein